MIEDTPVTADDLRRAGFGEKVIASVVCVTHRKDEPDADYVVRCKADDVARLRRYALSYKFLTDKITEEEYRTLMRDDR